MPELPEVETIRRDLQERLVGRTVTRVCVRRASVLMGGGAALRKAAEGREALACRRHGKVLIVDFAGGESLLIHPRMTGRVTVADDGSPQEYARVCFELADGGSLCYADCRALGKLEVCATGEEAASRSLGRFGPDALAEGALAGMAQRAGHRRAPIKALLLDQSVVAGIGNIYACEALYRARIAPDTPANQLTPAQWRKLSREARRVLDEALEARGTTFRDYRTGLGTEGEYALKLAVYGREGEPCRARRCKATIERIVQQQRSTFFCPRCQER